MSEKHPRQENGDEHEDNVQSSERTADTRRQLIKAGAGARSGLGSQCTPSTAEEQEPEQIAEHLAPGEPTKATIAANHAVLAELPFDDTAQFEYAQRGLIELTQDVTIPSDTFSRPSYDLSRFGFLQDDAPVSANPSLWRHAQLNMYAGLFEVVEGIYQVRGYDLSNVTFIETDSSVVVVDPLSTVESARAALELFYNHRPNNPIVAVIHTHSHADHFGGIKAMVTQEQAESGEVRIIAPEGFLNESVIENIFAGNAMRRRATYMYGSTLQPQPNGQIDAGDGKALSAGTVSLIAPTDIIIETGQSMTIDGVDFEFQLTPDTEAPAEMNFYLPQFRALCGAENAIPLVHDVYTLRGAQVRDAQSWAFYLNETVELYGDRADVMFCQHLWPRWGQEEVNELLQKLSDMYKYIHDQTLRLANHGFTANEIAEQVELPPSISDGFDFREYYGTVNQNTKAVYQRYLGWFDGNPAHLHQLPPAAAAQRYIEFMGGVDAVLRKSRQSFDDGDYRWVAEVLNHVIFADPSNADAAELLSHTYEQLGYQAESGPWRNFYLTGAAELRRGGPPSRGAQPTVGADIAAAMTPEMLFDYMGVRLNGPNAGGLEFSFFIAVKDSQESFMLRLRNSTVSYQSNVTDVENATATINLTHAALVSLAFSQKGLDELKAEEQIQISGDEDAFVQFLGLFDTFDFWFDIVTP